MTHLEEEMRYGMLLYDTYCFRSKVLFIYNTSSGLPIYLMTGEVSLESRRDDAEKFIEESKAGRMHLPL